MATRETTLLSRPLLPIPSFRSAGRRTPNVVRATAAAPRSRQRHPQNAEGDFFVDRRCIDCDTCRWMAPKTFTRVDGQSAVVRQPSCEGERVAALQALLSCPTGSIHTENPPAEILEVQKMFPLPIDEQTAPGVYHCGYHSEISFAATSYFITHPEGNILVDSPRFSERLACNIEILGGARYMFLTHKDDIGDHEKWSKRLGCERILHSADVEVSTADVETKLHGNGPWSLGADFELIHTPGHTEGSVCLYYKPLKVMFTGDHIAKSQDSDLNLAYSVIYNKQSISLQLKSIRKLMDFDFQWMLPGHGRRAKFRDNLEKNMVFEAFLSKEEPAYA